MRLDRACDGGRGNRKRRAVRGPWGRQSQTPTSDASSKRPVAARHFRVGEDSSVPVGTTTATPAKLLVSFFRHHSSNAAGATPKPHQPCASARRPCCSGLPGPTCPSTDLLLAWEREASVVQNGEPLPQRSVGPLENGLPAARHCCTLAVADVRVTNHGPRTSGLLFQRTLLSWFGAFSNTFVDQDYQTGPTYQRNNTPTLFIFTSISKKTEKNPVVTPVGGKPGSVFFL